MSTTAERLALSPFHRTAAAAALVLSLAGCTGESSHSSSDPLPSVNVRPSESPAEVPAVSSTPPTAPILQHSAPKPESPNPNVQLQRDLNDWLTPLGMPALTTDGKIGGQTKRALCAVRLFTGHAASKAPATLPERTELAGPPVLDSNLSGYIINKTCQVMGVKLNDKLSMIIPVSTARAGYSTPIGDFHLQYGRYGWHNSSLYPAEQGNGNMYDPEYFNGSIAVHGSPEMYPGTTSPHSHGCVRILQADAIKLWHLAGGPEHGKQDHGYDLKPIPVHVQA